MVTMNLDKIKKKEDISNLEQAQGEVVLYQTTDGITQLDVRFEGDSVWLTQEQIGLLFGKAKSTICEHMTNIFADGELDKNVVVRKFRTTTQHGAIAEYRKYQVRELSPVEKEYYESIKALKQATKKQLE